MLNAPGKDIYGQTRTSVTRSGFLQIRSRASASKDPYQRRSGFAPAPEGLDRLKTWEKTLRVVGSVTGL